MAEARYSPEQDITFDLARGLVQLEGAAPRVVVPAGALSALCSAAEPAAVTAFGKALGRAMGLRVAKRLAALLPGDGEESGARAASLETIVDHLGAELSLAGLGSMGLERWGRAMVVVIDHCPLDSAGDRLLEAVLAEAVSLPGGRQASAVLLARDGVRARLLLVNGAAAERVREWLGEGVAWGDAIMRLHGQTATDGPRA